MTAEPQRDALFDGAYPLPPFVLVGHVGGRQLRYLQIEDAARDVVAAAGLDDHVVRDGDAADGNAVAQVRVGHEIEPDDAGVGRGLSGLPPQRFVGLGEQRRRQERVDVAAHRAAARQHVVVIGQTLELLAKRHGSHVTPATRKTTVTGTD
jgi:hypothetical protein